MVLSIMEDLSIMADFLKQLVSTENDQNRIRIYIFVYRIPRIRIFSNNFQIRNISYMTNSARYVGTVSLPGCEGAAWCDWTLFSRAYESRAVNCNFRAVCKSDRPPRADEDLEVPDDKF
jgi:hypothetical protein